MHVIGLVQKVTCKEIVEGKSGKATGPSEASVEMTAASGKIGVKVKMCLCQQVLDDRGMPDNWKTSVIVPIFKEKGNVCILLIWKNL